MNYLLTRKMRITVAFLIVSMLVILIAACGQSAPTTTSTNNTKKEEPAQNNAKSEKAETPKKLTNKDIYMGADRDQLVKKAKEEGSITLYTSMNVKDAEPIVQAFEKKYGIKITLWRANSEKVLQKTLAEAQAGKHEVDMFETDSATLETLYREKILEQFDSPFFKDLPEDAIPKHKNWIATRFNFFVAAYNTKAIKKEDAPKTYEDFLDPKWKGKVGIEADDIDWFAALVKHMGQEKGMDYFKKIAAAQPNMRKGHTLMTELVAAGEIPLTLTVYNHAAENMKEKGAPIEWIPLNPTIARPNGVALSKNAAHPHASLLFADFLLSDGQAILKQINRVPASKKVDSNLNNFKYIMVDPVIVLDEWEKWSTEWEKLFIKK